jgi:hypothetical protein
VHVSLFNLPGKVNDIRAWQASLARLQLCLQIQTGFTNLYVRTVLAALAHTDGLIFFSPGLPKLVQVTIW